MQRSKGLALASALALYSSITYARTPEDCRSIYIDRDRLACYDSLFTPIEPVIGSETNDGQQITEEEVVRKRKFTYKIFDDDFSIQPYKATYILPYTYSEAPNEDPFRDNYEDLADEPEQILDNEELKYQISFKIPLAQDLFIQDSKIWLAYSQLSFWQMYNSDVSAPFRETNYEPEIFWEHETNKDFDFLNLQLERYALGFNHQSNGRGDELSRSWNRLFLETTLTHNRWTYTVKPWYRLPEDREDDDNPDIEDYLGYADYRASYQWDPAKIFSIKLRNNLKRHDNKTSVQLNLIFPLPGPLNGYLEYVNGYGETLIDYNYRSKRIGIGIILNEWK